jgi:hypothetical protein
MEFVGLAMMVCVAVCLVMRRNRERSGNAPLRSEIEARVCFETTLDRVRKLGTGGLGGTRGVWISVRGPKRLIGSQVQLAITTDNLLDVWQALAGTGAALAL